MGDVLLQVDTGNSEPKLSALEQSFAKLQAKVVGLEKDLVKQDKVLTTLSTQYTKLTQSTASASSSLSSLTAAVKGKTLPAIEELNLSLTQQYSKMIKIAKGVGQYSIDLRDAASAALTLKSQISGLNSAFAEKAALQGKLNLLSNTAYVAMVKESNALKEQIKLKETELGLRKAEAVAKEKATGATLAMASALDREAAARLKLNMLNNEQYVAALKNTREIDRQTHARMQALGLIDKEAQGTRHLNDAQKTLHQTARGLSGAMGSLWLTYGKPMAPMIAGFVAAASAVQSIKISAEVEYTVKLIETLSKSFGEAGESASKLREDLHAMKDTRQGIDQLALGMKEFVKAGISAAEGQKHLEEMARFATIAEVGMADAIKLVVANSNAFGETFTEVANKTAAAAFATTTDIKEIGKALQYATPLGSVLGISLSEVNTALGLLAQKGIESSMAGTSLTTTFMRLASPTDAAKKAMQELGVEFNAFGADGKLKSIKQQLTELSKIFSTLSDEKAVDLMGALSDLRSMKGLGNLIQDMGGDGKAWDDLYNKIDNAAKGITLLKTTSADLDETVTAKWEKLLATLNRLADSKLVTMISSAALDTASDISTGVEQILAPIESVSSILDKVSQETKAFVALHEENLARFKAPIDGLTQPLDAVSYAISKFIVELDNLGGLGAKTKVVNNNLGVMADVAVVTATKLEEAQDKLKEAPKQKTIFEILGVTPPTAETFQRIADMQTIAGQVTALAAQLQATAKFESGLSKDDAKQLDINAMRIKQGGTLNELDAEKIELEHKWAAAKEKSLALQAKVPGVTEDALTALKNSLNAQESFELAALEERFANKDKAKTKEITVEEARVKSLKDINDQLNTYLESADADSLKGKLESIEKERIANENKIIAEKGSAESLLKNDKVFLDKKAKIEESAFEEEHNRLQANLDRAEESENASHKRRLDSIEDWYKKELTWISKNVPEARQQESINAAKSRKLNEIREANEKLYDSQQKVIFSSKELDRTLAEIGREAGLGGLSELDASLAAIDARMDNLIDKAMKDSTSDADFTKKLATIEKLREELQKIEKAKLGDNIWDGFIAGVEEAQKEMLTLGKIGHQMAGVITSELSNALNDIFTGDNENPFADSITTIEDKIKQMQYDSLEGGAAQLAWLTTEYNKTLEGAMSGNQDMFEQYMSNLDEYLEKAKESMSPEEYAKLYEKTMNDLNKMNEEFGDQTETTWERISDAFGDMTDAIKASLMKMIADMVAQNMMGAIFGGGGSSGGGGITSGLLSDIDWSWLTSDSSSFQGYSSNDFSGTGSYLEYADGGVSGYGKLQGGSGVKDDLYLGKVNGKRVLAKGGEYIMPPSQTAKYYPILEEMRSGPALAFADGGYTSGSGMSGSSMTANDLIELLRQLSESGFAAAGATQVLADSLSDHGSAVKDDIGVTQASTQATQTATQATDKQTSATQSATQSTKGFAQKADDYATKATNATLSSKALGLAVAGLGLTMSPATTLALGFAVSLTKDTELGKALSKELGKLGEVVGDVVGAVVGAVAELGSTVATALGFTDALVSYSYDIAEFATDFSQDLTSTAYDAEQAAIDGVGYGLAGTGGSTLGDRDLSREQNSDRDSFGTPGGMLGGGGPSSGGGTSSSSNANDGTSGTSGAGERGVANGGWLGTYGSGWIHQGNGHDDDVYLGSQGNTDSYGMGGEFVVNKRSARKHADLLERINNDYGSGGGIPRLLNYPDAPAPAEVIETLPNYYDSLTKANTLITEFDKSTIDITEDLDDRLADIARMTEDAIYLITTSTMDDITKEIFDINKSYREQVKELQTLEATRADYALIEQSRNAELLVIQKEYDEELLEIQKEYDEEQYEMEKERLASLKELVDEANEYLWTMNFDSNTAELYELSQAAAELGDTLLGLGASFEELNLVAESVWAEINKVKLEQAKDSLEDAKSALETAFAAEKESVTSRYELVLVDLNKQLDTAVDKVGDLESIISALDSALDSLMGSDILQKSTFRAAQLDLARRSNTGDLSEGIEDTLEEAVKFDTNYYATAEEYQLDMLKSVKYIENLQNIAGDQLDAAEGSETSLNSLINSTESAMDAELAALDAQLTSLIGIQETVLTIAQAIANYDSAQGVVANGGRDGAGATNGTVFNTSDYIQAKAEDLVRTGWAKSITEASNLFLRAIAKDGSTPEQHFARWGEVENIYNLSTPEASVNPTTYGSPGQFNTADYTQAKAASLFNSGGFISVEAAKAAFIDAVTSAGGTPEQHFAQFGAAEGLYHFASGGSFKVGGSASAGDNIALPGMRVSVGEIVNVTNGDVMAELKAEIVALRAEMMKITSNTAVTAKQLSRWDGDGMPDVRTV